MSKVLFCIFCESLDVTERWMEADRRYEYHCHECYESWADDESELESSL